MRLYHGSNVEVKVPEIKSIGYYKDFGYGFYCTAFEKQAVRWALTKRPTHCVSVYDYVENPSLKILSFSEMCDAWLDFVVACRSGVLHDYDIVEGPMADDTIWDYVEDFIAGNITREAFWVLVKFKYPTHQLVFCTDRALQSLTFLNSYAV
jgi:hypothetical protein